MRNLEKERAEFSDSDAVLSHENNKINKKLHPINYIGKEENVELQKYDFNACK